MCVCVCDRACVYLNVPSCVCKCEGVSESVCKQHYSPLPKSNKHESAFRQEADIHPLCILHRAYVEM